MKRELGGFSTSELEQANYKISYKSTNISTSTFDLHDFILKKKSLEIPSRILNDSTNLQYVK